MPWTKIQADSYLKSDPILKKKKGRVVSYSQALCEALDQALEIDSRVYVMGEGVDDSGGIFGTTKNLHKKHGKKRVFDLPLAENGFTGFAVGSAITGMRPVLVHMRMDFMLLSMDQIINHASKWRYMFAGKQTVPLTIRCIIGRGWGSAAQHSQSLESLFMHIPGLRVIVPSNAYDAKGLLLASIACDDPVIFIEHRWLYNIKSQVPKEPYMLALDKAEVVLKGSDLTILAYSLMVHEALKAAQHLKKKGVSAEVIDLKTLSPLDKETILRSVSKTKRAVVASLDWKTSGTSAEIAAMISHSLFDSLKAPVERVALYDIPTPSSYVLEQAFYKDHEDIIIAAIKVMEER
ncbi:MAG: alpha-ketoacid dehydrogenase subunit beta [Candidatus Omnitrophica bacterium]|nr:alpha-ketoacid dehydrogenase subunit beta [Candidatus Omnitrophota bacterium]